MRTTGGRSSRLLGWAAFFGFAVSCGGGGGPSPSTPPVLRPAVEPLQPLAWRGVPERIVVTTGQPSRPDPYVVELVSGTTPVAGASVRAQLEGPDGAAIRVTAGAEAGEYLVFVTAETVGEWTIALAASLEGYEDARAESLLVSLPEFDLTFWRQFAFDALDCPTAVECGEEEVEERTLWVLPEIPDFYIDSTGFTATETRIIAERIPRVVEQLTGVPFRAEIVTGTEGEPLDGQVLIRALDEDDWEEDPPCGAARLGGIAGYVELHLECLRVSRAVFEELLSHELGHAFGFFHVDPPHVMQPEDWLGQADFTPTEISHARLAYRLGRHTPYTGHPAGTMFTAHRPPRRAARDGAGIISCFRGAHLQ